mgnify:CR=1 FL=1
MTDDRGQKETDIRSQMSDVRKTKRQQTVRADIRHLTSDIRQFLTSDL